MKDTINYDIILCIIRNKNCQINYVTPSIVSCIKFQKCQNVKKKVLESMKYHIIWIPLVIKEHNRKLAYVVIFLLF